MIQAGLLSNKENKKEQTFQQKNDDSLKAQITKFQLMNNVMKVCKLQATSQTSNDQTDEIIDKLHQLANEFDQLEDKEEKLRNKLKTNSIEPNNCDFYSLNNEKQDQENEKQEERTRVNVEALEFDWIFVGNNAKLLINVLANIKNTQVLSKKPIQMFINFMWSYYQKAIIIWIFIPYLIYMITFLYLTSGVISNVIERDDSDPENIEHFHHVCITPAVLTTISTAFCIFFAKQEIISILDSSIAEYYNDLWNWIDSVTLLLNFVFLMTITMNQVSERFIIDEYAIRRLGSFACFFMWIKVFYWMRLFEPLAKYVSLIITTIIDCLWFMALVLIIILSFTTFFYIINLNLDDWTNGEQSYITNYTNSGYTILDAFLQCYFICIGMFDVTVYGRGPDQYFIWIMFLLGTFINLIVFMNMLIAIMAKTFSDVMEKEQQSSIQEKISLINDHLFIVDYKKIFLNKKYLIKVSQINTEYTEIQDIQDYLSLLQTNFNRKFDQLTHVQNQKVVRQDNISRSFYKIQQETKNGIAQILKFNKVQQNFDKKNKNLQVENQQEQESNNKYAYKSNIKSVAIKKQKTFSGRYSNQYNDLSRDSEDLTQTYLKDYDNDQRKKGDSKNNVSNDKIQNQILKSQMKTHLFQQNMLQYSNIESAPINNSKLVTNNNRSQSNDDIQIANQSKPLLIDTLMKKKVQEVILKDNKINKVNSSQNSSLNEQKEMMVIDQQKDTNSLPQQPMQDIQQKNEFSPEKIDKQIKPQDFKKLTASYKSKRQMKSNMQKYKSEPFIIKESPFIVSPQKEENKTPIKQLSDESNSSNKVYSINFKQQQSKTVRFQEIEEIKPYQNQKNRTQNDGQIINQNLQDYEKEQVTYQTPQIKSKRLDPIENNLSGDSNQSSRYKRGNTLMNQIDKNLFEEFNRVQGKGQFNKKQKRKNKSDRK